MKFLVFAILAVGLTTSTTAGAMSKEKFIETTTKMKACVDAKYFDGATIEGALKTRTHYYINAHFED